MPGPRRRIPLLALALAAACDRPAPAPRLAEGVTREGLTSRLERFVPVAIDAPTRDLEPWERTVLARLVRASEAMHEPFLRQMAGGLPALRDALTASDSAWAPAAAAYFDRMAGPWDRLAGDAPFLDVGPRPAGGGFYPEDLTSSDLDAWLRDHPEDRGPFTDPFHVVRREHGTLIAVPYSAEYRETVSRVAELLREAASSSHSPSLKRYLEARASAVAGDSRFARATARTSFEGTRIEAAIGPYGRAEDRLRGAKAAFTGVVALVDSVATHGFDEAWAEPTVVAPLPNAAGRDGPARQFAGPVRVVDLVHAGGAARAGVHALALAVASGEHAGEGARTLVFRNVARAKFEHVLVPLAGIVLGPPEASILRFDPWFTVLLLRELSRAVERAPGLPEAAASTPAPGLGRDRAILEEARVGAMGVEALEAAAGLGRYDEGFVRAAYAAHLADLFRAARFGPADPRAEAAALQFGWAWERQAIQFDEESGAFTLERDAFVEANRELAAEILRVYAESDVAGAAALRDRYGDPRPELADFLPRLASLPVDIRPEYVAAERVLDVVAHEDGVPGREPYDEALMTCPALVVRQHPIDRAAPPHVDAGAVAAGAPHKLAARLGEASSPCAAGPARAVPTGHAGGRRRRVVEVPLGRRFPWYAGGGGGPVRTSRTGAGCARRRCWWAAASAASSWWSRRCCWGSIRG